ncbi:MAG TPA: hypothetical protein VGN85_09040 [Methyloceanibacter sp.]|nr:hypothetical protein [Methyloceanibacter sp.]
MTRAREEKSGDAPIPERGLDIPKRTTLAERLKAEQRKREGAGAEQKSREAIFSDAKREAAFADPKREGGGVEPKREEPKQQPEEAKPPLDFAEAAPGTPPPPRQFTRTRRPAGPPPQRRLATPANDDLPSIGGLIFALQQRPSRTPFLIALAASVAWFIIGGFFAFGLISAQVSAGGVSGLVGSASALTAAVAILVPIVIFWFLALLVWRAQELRLMASAMTEVAVRLAEPDKLAEQSVASVGQTIRRQVAAMNDAISRAIGRASELEAMVHSEVAALERSYGENELRVRNLISELATEREALANNSQRVSEALKGVGAQVARDISTASSTIDKKLAERGLQLTELLVSRSSEAAEQVHKAQTRVTEAVPGLLERLSKEQGRLSQVIEGATQNLAALESVVVQRTTSLDKTMKERTEALQTSLASRIKGLETSVAQGAILLDKTLKDRTDAFATSIGQGTAGLDKTMKDRTEALNASVAQGAVVLEKTLKDRTEAFTGLVSQGAVLFDNTLKQRTEALTVTIGQGAAALDKTLKDRTEAFVVSVGQGAGQLDKALRDRTEAFTGLVSQGAVVLDKTLQERTNALANAIGQGAAMLDKTLIARTGAFNAMVDQRALLLDKQLIDRTGAFAAALDQRASLLDKSLHDRTSQFITAINQGTMALDKSLAERAEGFTNSLFQRVRALETAISQQTGTLDKTMTERAQAVIMALAERLKAIDATFSQRTTETDRMLGEHARATEATFGKQTAQLNQVLANNSAMIRQTADQVGAQSKEAVSILTSQTQTLRDVSRGLLEQIHGLTQRFENQGQAILTAAKALDSSNTKIDSILEGRHQAIIALLHTVNTKAKDLDNMMRSYAGMLENAMSGAEARAKQVGSSLARDTAGQTQQALAQIERLREEAQAHTARAVGDLKGSFETIITQIGRQLEQMRGQFDNTSRGMREAAKQTATDLDGMRQEMQKRMESMPEHTAQATAAIRKALTDQLKEIESITPALTRAATQNVAAQVQANAPDPYRQPPMGRPAPQHDLPPMPRGSSFAPQTEEARPAASRSDLPPLPRFDGRGRPVPGQDGGDLGQVAGGLAQQLAGVSQAPRGQGAWGGGDPLSSDPGYAAGGQGFGTRNAPPVQAGSASGQLRLDEIARAIDHRTAAEVWQRFRAGERGVLGRHIYSPEGQTTFDEISRRYDRESDFRMTVDRYIGDFERLLGEAEQTDPDGRMLQSYLTSENGRVYLLLAHASGRLR